MLKKDGDNKGRAPDRGALEDLDRLAARLENSGVAEYVRLSQRTGRILWLNFISGIARGLGFTVGTALVLALAYKVLSHIISMNIPYITEILSEFVKMINAGGGS